MSTPAEIANDATAEADVLRTEVADLLQQLEEANAVIDAVRGARGIIRQQVAMLERSAWSDRPSTRMRLDDYRTCLGLLDEVPGL